VLANYIKKHQCSTANDKQALVAAILAPKPVTLSTWQL